MTATTPTQELSVLFIVYILMTEYFCFICTTSETDAQCLFQFLRAAAGACKTYDQKWIR